MPKPPSDVAFTPAVKAAQARLGSRDQFARMEAHNGWAETISPDLMRILAATRSCYLATASAEGQPYVQHRGGPAGFLKPLDEKRIGFADYRGNRQYITAGNLSENPRALIFIMDYKRGRRVKIWGEAQIMEDDAEFLAQVMDPSYAAAPERAIVFTVKAWDQNCHQHIPRMLHIDEVAAAIAGMERRIADLEAENARLRAAAGLT